MTLIKYSPFNDLLTAQNRIGRLVDTLFDGTTDRLDQASGVWMPEVDIEETENEIILRADLPGMTKDNIQLTVENNQLILRGTREKRSASQDRGYHRLERTYGSFNRWFDLPATVLRDKVEATYRDGVLEVTLPKAEEVRPKSIPVKS